MKRKGDFWGVLGGNKGEGKATRPARGVVVKSEIAGVD